MKFAVWSIAAFASLVWGAHGANASIIYNSDNSHYYMVVPSGSAGSGSWSDAFVAAQTYSYQGVTGHLVTIVSQAEQAFVNTIIAPYERGGTLSTTDSFWIGGVRTNFSVA